MKLTERIDQDITQAAKDQDQPKLSALRMLKNSVNNLAKDAGKEAAGLADEEIVKIIQKDIKQRRESAQSYRQGQREELASREEEDIKIFSQYLPKQLSQEELGKIIDQAISETGASSVADMGRVMGLLNQKVSGQADMGQVSQLVKDKLEKK